MLEAKEIKVVLATLTQRRAFLMKGLDKPDLDAKAREEQIATLKHLDSSIKKISKLASSKSAVAKPQSPSPASIPKKTAKRQAIAPEDAYVLIAEDNADSAELLKTVLEDMGILKIDIVEDGRAAVRALENCSPAYDVVLCDWDMPEMNGLQVRKAIKPLAKLRDTHFMMVTANSETSRIKEAIRNGVNDYIVKPVDIDILETKLKAALAGGEQHPKEEMIAVKKQSTS